MDVVDGQVRLAWKCSDDAADFMERADAIGLGISVISVSKCFQRNLKTIVYLHWGGGLAGSIRMMIIR